MEKYLLKSPVQFGSEKITEVDLSCIKMKHMKQLPAAPTFWDLMVIASKASAISINVFEEMSPEDGRAIAEIVGKSLVGSQATGS